MFATLCAITLHGVDAIEVAVELDASNGMPSFQIGGLGDSAIKESKQRVISAIKNSGYKIPPRRITVNLAPADLKKEGTCYDLAIAIGLLIATNQIEILIKGKFLILGELSLDGKLRPVSGILPAAIMAKKQQYDGLILPKENQSEASVVEDIKIIGVNNLLEAIKFLSNEFIPNTTEIHNIIPNNENYPVDFSDIKGQEGVKRALTIAAAGGHNLICIGPPGSGKTMSARAIPSILPSLSKPEMLETSKIYSVAGLLPTNYPLIHTRPFRAPHHSISEAGLVGGGSNPMPGEVSLSHNGVLFLDELTEFNLRTLESLRQPLEDKKITISRAKRTVTFPSNTMLLAAMNPCPCGFYGSNSNSCTCTSNQIQKYLSKVSGPLLDRIDMHIEAPPVNKTDLLSNTKSETSASIKIKVENARNVQLKRFQNQSNMQIHSCYSNSDMNPRQIKQFCLLNTQNTKLMEKMFDNLNFSARSYNKVLKIARTIADLDDSKNIEQNHLLEAIQYRTLDRKYWG